MSNNEYLELLEKGLGHSQSGPWEIGDALLKGCPIGDNRDKKYREECRRILQESIPVCKKKGFMYGVSRLREFRTISHVYPADRRRADIGYEVHVVARDPDILDFLIQKLPPGQELTKRHAKEQVKRIHEIERAKWRETHGLEPIPANRPLPVGDLRSYAFSLKLLNNAYSAVKLAEDTEKMLNQQGPHDSADNALLDAAMRAHQAWLSIVSRIHGIKESKPNKRPHLTAVNI